MFNFNPNSAGNAYTTFTRLFETLDSEEEMCEMAGTVHHKAPSFGDEDATME